MLIKYHTPKYCSFEIFQKKTYCRKICIFYLLLKKALKKPLQKFLILKNQFFDYLNVRIVFKIYQEL